MRPESCWAGQPPSSGPGMGPGLLGPRDSGWPPCLADTCYASGVAGQALRQLGFHGHMGSVMWFSGLQDAKDAPHGVQMLGEARLGPQQGQEAMGGPSGVHWRWKEIG